jgi:hypothetical protein
MSAAMKVIIRAFAGRVQDRFRMVTIGKSDSQAMPLRQLRYLIASPNTATSRVRRKPCTTCRAAARAFGIQRCACGKARSPSGWVSPGGTGREKK